MKQRIQKAVALGFVLIMVVSLITSAQAADGVTTATTSSGLERAEGLSDPWIFGGADVGAGSVATGKNSFIEPSKTGLQVDLRALLAFYWTRWIAEGGMGWRYDRFQGAMGNLGDQTIITRSGLAELGARYRLTERWSVGPTLNLAFGADQTQGTSLDSQNTALLAGAQVFYEVGMMSQKTRLRIGLRALTDLDIPDRTKTAIQLGIQIGWGFTRKSEVQVAQAPIAAPEDREQKINILVSDIHFETGKSALKPRTKAILAKLGAFLEKNSEIWGKVMIEGHTDKRGSLKLNQSLSERRAKAVSEALAGGGATRTKLNSRGLNFSQPLVEGETAEAYAKNRRVELVFSAVSDRSAIRDYISMIEQELKETASVQIESSKKSDS